MNMSACVGYGKLATLITKQITHRTSVRSCVFNKMLLSRWPYGKHKCVFREASSFTPHTERPELGQVVYNGLISRLLRNVKFFSITTSGLTVILQPIMISNVLSVSATTLQYVAYFSFVAIFVFITPLMIHLVGRKYVTKLYFNDQTKQFCAVTYNILGLKRELSFTAEDVDVPDIPGLFTSVIVKRKPLFMDSRLFTDTEAYAHLMGYDKPIDLRFDDEKDERVAK